MKHLISHLLKTNLDEIMAKSCLNCHVKGVHSIMLLESPGKTIRLFVATPEHVLWKNYSDFRRPTEERAQSVAYHSHHCQLTLQSTRGSFTNAIVCGWSMAMDDSDAVRKYRYKSAIKNGSGGFELESPRWISVCVDETTYNPGEAVFMEASDVHTVAVLKGEWAAWLVFEGKEDAAYEPVCYSNAPLDNTSLDGLYGKLPSVEVLMELLKEANLV